MNYSILMSVYHKEHPEYLKQAIESMLNQTVKSNDFVIVCDGPLTDELYKILDFYESNPTNQIHRLQLDKNYGLGIALNKGLEICKNELVARMDSDDIAVTTRIEKQLKEFHKNNELTVCGSYLQEFNESVGDTSTIKKVPLSNEEIAVYLKKRNPFNHMTVMFKKSVIKDCGSYEDCYLNEDYYLWAKVISNNYYTMNIPDVLVFMRVGNGMYDRRGGIKYIKGDFIMQRNLMTLNCINFFEFIINIFVRSLVRILPTFARKKIYIEILRKET